MSSNFIYLQSKTFMLRIRVCTYTRNRQTRAWFGTHFSCFADHKEWKVAKTQKRTPIVPRSLCPFTTEYKWSNNPCSYIFHFNAVFIQGLGQLWLHLVPCAAGTSWCTTSEVCAKKNSSHQFSPVCAPGKLVPTGHGMPKVCSRGVCDGSHWTRLLQQWIWLSVKSEDMNNRASPCWHLHCDGWLPP